MEGEEELLLSLTADLRITHITALAGTLCVYTVSVQVASSWTPSRMLCKRSAESAWQRSITQHTRWCPDSSLQIKTNEKEH